MFNAISNSLTGNEAQARSIRLLIAIELYENRTFYSSHPYLQRAWKMEDNPFAKESIMFSQILLDDALDIYKRSLDNKEECVKTEAQLCAKDKNFSSMNPHDGSCICS